MTTETDVQSEGVKRFIYHYYAKRHISAEQTIHTDGILNLTQKIKSMEDYRQIKKLIADQEPVEGLTICSMSYLGEDN